MEGITNSRNARPVAEYMRTTNDNNPRPLSEKDRQDFGDRVRAIDVMLLPERAAEIKDMEKQRGRAA